MSTPEAHLRTFFLERDYNGERRVVGWILAPFRLARAILVLMLAAVVLAIPGAIVVAVAIRLYELVTP